LVSHTRRKYRLRLVENRVLRRILEPKRDDVTGGRRPYNEEQHNLCASPNIINVTKSKRMTWVGRVARMGEMRNVYHILVVKPEGKRPL